MADEDFDVAGLAAYLHLSTQQVQKLADRAKLPARRVGGAWRFAAAEVHHWLENRIGLSDDLELAQMEGVLEKAALQAPTRIVDLMPLQAMAVPLLSRTRNAVIHDLVEVAAKTGGLWDAKKMAEAVLSREEMHPTALENGVALLHPRRPLTSILGQPLVAFGRTLSGIHFGSRTPTDCFFLILSIDDTGHLQTLARLSRIVNDAALLEELRQAPDAALAHQAIAKREGALE